MCIVSGECAYQRARADAQGKHTHSHARTLALSIALHIHFRRATRKYEMHARTGARSRPTGQTRSPVRIMSGELRLRG